MFERLEAFNQKALRLFRERSRQTYGDFGLQLIEVRERLVALRQSLSPFREIMGRITRGEFALVQGVNLPRFGDLYDSHFPTVDFNIRNLRNELHVGSHSRNKHPLRFLHNVGNNGCSSYYSCSDFQAKKMDIKKTGSKNC